MIDLLVPDVATRATPVEPRDARKPSRERFGNEKNKSYARLGITHILHFS
jgi:hypothetical protein